MSQIFDSTGMFQGTIENGAGGQHVVKNAVGEICQVFHPMNGGGGYWTDAYGSVLGRVQTIGDTVQHFSPTYELLGSTSQMAGKTFFNDALGSMIGSHDPMTGNFSNAIGQLTGFSR